MEVTIKTKYELGQQAVIFKAYDMKLHEITISEIQFEVSDEGTRIWYRDEMTGNLIKESQVFASKEEFISQL